MNDPRCHDLKTDLQDWTAPEAAKMKLAVALGIIPPDLTYDLLRKLRFVFFTDNPVERALYETLLQLVAADILLFREGDFKWNPDFDLYQRAAED